MFIKTLFVILKISEEPKCAPTYEECVISNVKWDKPVCNVRWCAPTYNGMVFSHKKEISPFALNGAWGHYVHWNKSDRQRQILYNLAYMWNSKQTSRKTKFIDPKDRQVVTRGRRVCVKGVKGTGRYTHPAAQWVVGTRSTVHVGFVSTYTVHSYFCSCTAVPSIVHTSKSRWDRSQSPRHEKKTCNRAEGWVFPDLRGDHSTVVRMSQRCAVCLRLTQCSMSSTLRQ